MFAVAVVGLATLRRSLRSRLATLRRSLRSRLAKMLRGRFVGSRLRRRRLKFSLSLRLFLVFWGGQRAPRPMCYPCRFAPAPFCAVPSLRFASGMRPRRAMPLRPRSAPLLLGRASFIPVSFLFLSFWLVVAALWPRRCASASLWVAFLFGSSRPLGSRRRLRSQ